MLLEGGGIVSSWLQHLASSFAPGHTRKVAGDDLGNSTIRQVESVHVLRDGPLMSRVDLDAGSFEFC